MATQTPQSAQGAGGLRELRVALVCYGGVSLAIYMHGVTKEIEKLVVASAAFEGDDQTNPFAPSDSSHAWWSLLAKLRDERDGVRLRVIVDIIAGTSAGGINGVFLAKALANNRGQDALRQLWFEKGDIAKLLRGPTWMPKPIRAGWVAFGTLTRQRAAKPPLRGDQMCVWLHDALTEMDRDQRALSGRDTLVPPDQDLDLFVPITDFAGYDREIPIGDPRFIKDTTHRHVLTFHHVDPTGSQLGAPFNHALAFAARATSSFPGAFPPVSFGDYEAAVGGRVDLARDLLPLFSIYELNGSHADRTWFIDGGVLDNFPFAAAIDAIGRHPAGAEVDRRLVYIDPNPGSGGTNPNVPEAAIGRPGLLATVWGGYAAIPRQEAIVDDLERVADRNEDVARVRDIIEANFAPVSDEVDNQLRSSAGTMPATPTAAELAAWRLKVETRAATVFGLAYPSYVRARVQSIVTDAAAVIAQARGFPPESYQARFVADVLRQWARSEGLFDQEPAPTPAQLTLLGTLDAGYHARRIRFLVAAVNWWYRDCGRPGYPTRAELDDAKQRFYGHLGELVCVITDVAGTEEVRRSVASVFSAATLQSVVLERSDEVDKFVAEHRTELEDWRDRLAAAVAARIPVVEEGLHADIVAMCAGWAPEVGGALLTRYIGFPFWDVLTFPVTVLSGLGERDAVDVLRLSPADTRLLADPHAHKLKGVAISHFGAFFSRPGRENDYLWGRLDAAERLTALIFDDPAREGLDPPVPSDCKPVFEAILADEAGLANVQELLGELRTKVAGLT
jgi:patatin-related protein